MRLTERLLRSARRTPPADAAPVPPADGARPVSPAAPDSGQGAGDSTANGSLLDTAAATTAAQPAPGTASAQPSPDDASTSPASFLHGGTTLDAAGVTPQPDGGIVLPPTGRVRFSGLALSTSNTAPLQAAPAIPPGTPILTAEHRPLEPGQEVLQPRTTPPPVPSAFANKGLQLEGPTPSEASQPLQATGAAMPAAQPVVPASPMGGQMHHRAQQANPQPGQPGTQSGTLAGAQSGTQGADAQGRNPLTPGDSRVTDVTTLTLHEDYYYDIKEKIQHRLLELMDLTAADGLHADKLTSEITRLTEKILREEFRQVPLNGPERKQIVEDIIDDVTGLGPLEPLLRDPTINDILVNNYRMVYAERRGKLIRVQTRFNDDDHLRKIIDRIVSRIGRRVDESSPMVDARLADGSRVNAIIPPLALDGPSLSIRRFSKDPLELHDLVRFGALTEDMGEVLRGIVKARLNILVSGGTGSGKTTMLNCLSRFVPHDERIVTIEDAAELQLKQDHVVRLETRPANIEGHGEVNARDLVKNCLRMRPDRIIVGEVRSAEVLDMLQAMNTGHDGSLTTIHANTPRDCLMRLETMVAMSGLNISPLSLKRYIASAIDVIIQVSRLSDGSRKLTSLMEVTGMEGDAITMQEIFAYEQTGIDENNKVIGHFVSRGIRPHFAPRLAAMGITLSGSLFTPAGQDGG